jgi:hypothetical protein
MSYGLTFLAVIGLIGVPMLAAETVTNLPSADTSLFEGTPDGNLGRTTALIVGATANGAIGRALVRFPLAGIPSGARITSAELRFEVVRVPQMRTPEPSPLDVRRVELPWIEGDSSDNLGGQPNPGEPTWNSRSHGSTAWGEPGGQIGTDVSADIRGTSSRSLVGVGSYSVPSTPELVRDVQSWLDDPASNHGWMLMSRFEDRTATARRLGTREEPFSSTRLVIGFSVPPRLSIRLEEGAALLRFPRMAGAAHRVEFRDSLEGVPWSVLTNLPALPRDEEATATDRRSDLPSAGRFYRLVLP